jgi:hypothetical protein
MNSKEENSKHFCPNYAQEFVLRYHSKYIQLYSKNEVQKYHFMERLDQGLLYCLPKHPRLPFHGWESLAKSYSNSLLTAIRNIYMSSRQLSKIYIRKQLLRTEINPSKVSND